MSTPSVPAAGPVADRIVAGLAGIPAFDQWRSGALDRDAYARQLDRILALPESVPLNENQRALSARMYWDDGALVAATLRTCAERGLLPSADYDVDGYLRFRDRMHAEWDHGGRITFIFPEEARLLYAVASVVRPRRVAVLGSYYAYWAVWALAGAGDALESAVLLDVDPEANALAEANLTRLGLADRVTVLTADAVDHMRASTEAFDMLVLDAEGPDTGPDPRRLGKAIYGPIAEAALPRLAPGGVLATHNVLLDDLVRHPYFEALAAKNRTTLAEFLAVASATCSKELVVPTTEGTSLHVR